MPRRRSQRAYVIVWRYRVRRGAEQRFERIYGPRGAWARLFRKSRGYLGTQLFREVGQGQSAGVRYVTIDMWRSRAAFDAFHRRHHAEYQRIDHQCDALTLHEEEIGAYPMRA
jgi:heme-degrading monooxygenase HmoA